VSAALGMIFSPEALLTRISAFAQLTEFAPMGIQMFPLVAEYAEKNFVPSFIPTSKCASPVVPAALYMVPPNNHPGPEPPGPWQVKQALPAL
jgi:hypothetical protein